MWRTLACTNATSPVTFDPMTIYGITVSSIAHPNNSGFYPGLNLDLTCSVSVSSDTPDRSQLSSVTAVWTRSGDSPVVSHDHVTTTDTVQVEGSVGSYQSNMSFSPLALQDGGDYDCTVTCELDSGEALCLVHSRTLLFDSEWLCVFNGTTCVPTSIAGTPMVTANSAFEGHNL